MYWSVSTRSGNTQANTLLLSNRCLHAGLNIPRHSFSQLATVQNEVYGQDEYMMGGRTPGHATPLRSPYAAAFGTPSRMNPDAMNSPLKSPLAGLNFGAFSPLAGGGFSPTRSPGGGLGGYSPTSPGVYQ